MKAIEQHFLATLFIILNKLVLRLSVCMKSCGLTIEMKGTEQYFPLVLFFMLYKVVLAFECG